MPNVVPFRDASHLEFCLEEQRVIFTHDPRLSIALHNEGEKTRRNRLGPFSIVFAR